MSVAVHRCPNQPQVEGPKATQVLKVRVRDVPERGTGTVGEREAPSSVSCAVVSDSRDTPRHTYNKGRIEWGYALEDNLLVGLDLQQLQCQADKRCRLDQTRADPTNIPAKPQAREQTAGIRHRMNAELIG